MHQQGYSITGEEIDKYIEAERRIYAERQKAVSEDFMRKVNNISQINVPIVERNTYISKYAPCIQTELTKNELMSISHYTEITSIYYSPNLSVESSIADFPEQTNTTSIAAFSDILSAIHVPYTRDTLGYDGTGIKIGVLESALPDTSANYLASANITCISSAGCLSDENAIAHASLVTGILVGQVENTKGIVPNATIYVAGGGTYYDNIEWLIDQGVSIITASLRFDSTPNGKYNAHEQWIDHLAINHSVHFIKSSGNNFYYVSTPGMSFNTITVGAANNSFNDITDFTSYRKDDTSLNGILPDKPDIIAPGDHMNIFGIEYIPDGKAVAGTSFATPIVTGIATQMMQANPILKTCQDSLKSCILASIPNETLRYQPGTQDYTRCGAGLIDAQSAVNTARVGRFTVNQYFNTSASITTTKEISFMVSSSDTIKRISLTWLINNSLANSQYTHSWSLPPLGDYVDLDLKIYDPNGNLVASSTTTFGNVEIAQFIPTVQGTYTAKISIKNSPTSKTYFSVSWW